MTLRPVDDDWSVPEAEDPEAWCAWCGTALPDFPTRYRRFCSRDCKDKLRIADEIERRAAARAGRKCIECGSAFEAMRYDSNHCSRRCRDRGTSRKRFGTRQCLHCGKDFVPSAARVRCCSISCGRKRKPAKADAFSCEMIVQSNR